LRTFAARQQADLLQQLELAVKPCWCYSILRGTPCGAFPVLSAFQEAPVGWKRGKDDWLRSFGSGSRRIENGAATPSKPSPGA